VSAPLYREQVILLLRVLPIIARVSAFALKGGTAINLFVRNFPRLSVDIDRAYLPLGDRVAALSAIHDGLRRIAQTVEWQLPGVTVHESRRPDIPKLFIDARGARIKVEPNTVFRGSVFTPLMSRTVPEVEAEFERAVTTPTLSVADLYGGKIVAALDRQHPRDLFDVKLLLEAEGITKEIRTAFVVYLASHARPMAELLMPRLKPIAKIFESE
jgi:predicted nucleotidyltransferase component of viral defense system